MADPTLELLRELVAIDSINPSLVPSGGGEGEIARAVEAEMRSIGLDVEVAEVAPGRPNVVGVLAGRGPGRSLLLCGHLDTVGVEGMAAPFDPVERDGRLYGRGAQDMKGGVAAMIGAARRVAESGGLAGGRLIVAAVMDEEYASAGAEALVRGGWSADAAVVTEPTDLAVGMGHKGFSWIEVAVEGRSAHGSLPSEGRDAILRMGRVLSRLEKLDRELQARTPHPILGTGSLHASLIQGGRELSSYPDRCVLQMERRTLAGETGATAAAEIETVLATLRNEDPELRAACRLFFERPAYETPAGQPLPRLLEDAIGRIGRSTRRIGLTFWTDAAVLGRAGIPAVLFGPGGAGLHSTEEYVRIEEVFACRDALAELAREFCGG
jgi:acetylornithine deacetylase